MLTLPDTSPEPTAVPSRHSFGAQADGAVWWPSARTAVAEFLR